MHPSLKFLELIVECTYCGSLIKLSVEFNFLSPISIQSKSATGAQNPVRVALSCFKGGKEEVVGKNRQQTKEPRMWSNSMQSSLLHYWQTAQTDGSEM